MSRVLFVVSAAALLLAGCAEWPKPPLTQAPHHQVVPRVMAAPLPPIAVAPVTPNQVVKKRFWDKFPKHPKFFH